MIRVKWSGWWAAVAVALWLRPTPAAACAVCFGAPDSAMTKGMAWGILSLLVVIVCVLGGFAAFFVYLARRASAVEAPVAEPQLVESSTVS